MCALVDVILKIAQVAEHAKVYVQYKLRLGFSFKGVGKDGGYQSFTLGSLGNVATYDRVVQ